ncbi:MAG: hypothetical protein IT287_03075 [Bdellovibrionaceae bacterium]|nr:hypothetical protein [Pseudobdellovibrionaceae bacterium]
MKTVFLTFALFLCANASATPIENVYEIFESFEGSYQGKMLSGNQACTIKIETLKTNSTLKVTLQTEDGTIKEDTVSKTWSRFEGHTGYSDDKYILLASRFKGWWLPRDEYRVWINTSTDELTSVSLTYIQGGIESLYGGFTEYSDLTCIDLVKTETQP